MIICESRQQRQMSIEQSIVMDSGTARISDEGADQGVLRMDQEEGISTEEQARRRLRSKHSARRSLTDDETVSKRLKREATIAAIKQKILKTAAERRDLEQAHKFYASIRRVPSRFMHREWWRSIIVEKEEFLKDGVDKQRWQGGQMFNARWVDEQHKEKSRYLVKDFANTRMTMFAAVSVAVMST